MHRKQLSWEDSEKYIIISHHDEHQTDAGLVDLVRIEKCGTILELLDETPRNRTSGDCVPKRTYRRSGLSETILPLESFLQWFNWFKKEEVYGEYKVEIQVEDEDVSTVVSCLEL